MCKTVFVYTFGGKGVSDYLGLSIYFMPGMKERFDDMIFKIT